eukprot:3144637-Pyramimonas_sp.AAC.1
MWENLPNLRKLKEVCREAGHDSGVYMSVADYDGHTKKGGSKQTAIPYEVELEARGGSGKPEGAEDIRNFYGQYASTAYKAKGSTQNPWILMVEKYDADMVAWL